MEQLLFYVIQDVSFEFHVLVDELGLGGGTTQTNRSATTELQSTDFLKWPRDNHQEIIAKWCETACQKVLNVKISKVRIFFCLFTANEYIYEIKTRGTFVE